MFRLKETLRQEELNYTIHYVYQFRYGAVKVGPFKQETQEEQQRDETCEKYTDCRGIQRNPSLGQNTGLQEKCNRHVNRMARNRLHTIIKNYISKGMRKHGNQLKRVPDA